MAQQGRAAEALTAAFTSSFIGSLVAVLLITFLAPMISSFALKFGPPYLLTFCSFVGLGREAKHKTVISVSLGVLLAGRRHGHGVWAALLLHRLLARHHPGRRHCRFLHGLQPRQALFQGPGALWQGSYPERVRAGDCGP